MSAAQQSPRPGYSFAPFYKECAKYPELPKFRRFTAQWTKKLYDDAQELLEREEDLSRAIAEFQISEGGVVMSALECPRKLVRHNHRLQDQWMEYNKMLRSYSQDLFLCHQLIHLPSHSPLHSTRLNRSKELFDNGFFIPTGESASVYQDRASPDFVAWAEIPESDMLTNFYVNWSEWIEAKLIRRLRALFTCHRPVPHGSQQTTFRFSTLVTTIDLMTCVFVPLLLTANMFALESISPVKIRIAVVGIFGLAFALSARAISSGIHRGEIFAFTAAYFAVASVFVSGMDEEVVRPS